MKHSTKKSTKTAAAAATKKTAVTPVEAPKPVVAMDTNDRKRANKFRDALKAAGIEATMGRERGGSQVYVTAEKFEAATKVLDATFHAPEPSKADKAAAKAEKDAPASLRSSPNRRNARPSAKIAGSLRARP